MRISKTSAARLIAKQHAWFDEDLLQVFRIVRPVGEDQPDEPIKLLEVNLSTASAGIMPVYFDPSKAVPYSSIIVEITPKEYHRLLSRQLLLPDDWQVAETLFSRNPEKSVG